MAIILILNGPNMNLLGTREPDLYGSETLSQLTERLTQQAQTLQHQLICFQSNAEAELIDCLQRTTAEFIIFNPAAFTHTSIALRDTLLAIHKPFIEVHLSNIHRREAFRQHSYFSDIAAGNITGLGTHGYVLALQYAHHYLSQE